VAWDVLLGPWATRKPTGFAVPGSSAESAADVINVKTQEKSG
jgi:hypothetical protein